MSLSIGQNVVTSEGGKEKREDSYTIPNITNWTPSCAIPRVLSRHGPRFYGDGTIGSGFEIIS